jgi:putative Mg2+ transporter-C (MgtC) family protein
VPITLSWSDIALRLLLAVIAGALIGAERGEQGRPAGLRTTLLVCLAATVAMIQANLLLATDGKTSASFAVADVMRLPLGILSGMGFIGAGAIIHRRDLVLGVTTAATLWFVTVIGLCFGGGDLGLGAAATILGLLVLSGLKHLERFMPAEHRATLTLAMSAEGPEPSELSDILARAGFQILKWSAVYRGTTERSLQCELRWQGRHGEQRLPPVLLPLAQHPGIHELRWRS